jgi:hypothetical protein
MKNHAPRDPVRLLRASKLRVGTVRAQGVPAILLGVAAIVVGAATIVLSAGATRALQLGAPALPETLRELRMLLESRRAKPLNP